jgi:hypothetical protein
MALEELGIIDDFHKNIGKIRQVFSIEKHI